MAHNQRQNFFAIYCVSMQGYFPTFKAELEIQYNEVCIRVAP